jgi:hypothetical protein
MPDRPRGTGSTLDPALIPDQELAAIILRAAVIGVPAWRVITALGVPSPAWASGDEPPPAR